MRWPRGSTPSSCSRQVHWEVPRLRLVPTGGIGLADVPAYLGSPNVLAVGGTWVAPVALVRDGRFDEIARLAAAAAEAVAGCRAQQGTPS
jgi:2-keto-3-deoxy-6-phosphogluconate aldolase